MEMLPPLGKGLVQILAGCIGATLTLTNPRHQQAMEPPRPLAQGAAGVDLGKIFL